MTQTDSDELQENLLLGAWDEVADSDSDSTIREWVNPEREMRVLVETVQGTSEAEDDQLVSLEQFVTADGVGGYASTHFVRAEPSQDPESIAHAMMEDVETGTLRVTALCAFDEGEVVDFACIYLDETPDSVDVDELRETVHEQLGDQDPVIRDPDEAKDLDEFDQVTIDVFPMLDTEVRRGLDDGEDLDDEEDR